MSLGLKRGTVKLLPHQDMWDKTAKDTISLLSDILVNIAVSVEHVGSTAVQSICAKPIIDIAVGINELDDILPYIDVLRQNGIVFRGKDVDKQYLFVIGDFKNDIRTHHIHVVEYNSTAWKNYINFRNYLNSHPAKAEEYDILKKSLADKFYNDRKAYTSAKQKFINEILVLSDDFYKENI